MCTCIFVTRAKVNVSADYCAGKVAEGAGEGYFACDDEEVPAQEFEVTSTTLCCASVKMQKVLMELRKQFFASRFSVVLFQVAKEGEGVMIRVINKKILLVYNFHPVI